MFWYAWHLSWLNNNPVSSEIATLLFVILSSVFVGFVADRTGSVLAAASVHVIGNIMATTTDFQTIIPAAQSRMTIVIACVVMWLIILRFWRAGDVRRGRVHEVAEARA